MLGHHGTNGLNMQCKDLENMHCWDMNEPFAFKFHSCYLKPCAVELQSEGTWIGIDMMGLKVILGDSVK